MSLIIPRTVFDALGFDLEQAVANFAAELAQHASTVDQPAPASHPLVEQIVRSHGGNFSISAAEDDPAQAAMTRLLKAELWRRLSDDEAEALDAALVAAPARLRRIYEAATYLDTTDADYPALRAGIVAALGEARADEVLSPTM